MRKISVTVSVSLDGVLQAPGRPDEDVRGGFQPDNPFTEVLDRTPKYVASRTLDEPLPWQNSILLSGDAADSVAELKRQPGPDLAVLGSGNLVQTLRRARLVDEYLLLIHPLLLGAGTRLFPDGPPADLRLAESLTTTTGVIIASYRQA